MTETLSGRSSSARRDLAKAPLSLSFLEATEARDLNRPISASISPMPPRPLRHRRAVRVGRPAVTIPEIAGEQQNGLSGNRSRGNRWIASHQQERHIEIAVTQIRTSSWAKCSSCGLQLSMMPIKGAQHWMASIASAPRKTHGNIMNSSGTTSTRGLLPIGDAICPL